ncbi:hypothetical protein A6A04_12680 [Paramagnetospirillum marisnigri]|uniref:FecR protein domain-containing protein n=1 Tax=Paramagnetospirillum marisnigri TaxID=1285242 RepID=A0A178MVB2_9PROT|nr:hypothetical protein A6A04_12680 [Paramagnetospirillum marisnigri]
MFLLMSHHAARAEAAALITRLQGMVQAVEARGSRSLAVGDPVNSGDRLRTGPGARLELRFADGMDLTLGEGAELVVESFAWAPAANRGKAELAVLTGAFLVESGRVGKLPDHPLLVKTPMASVGVRGTKFWGGSLGDPLNVLLLDGRIVVTSPKGAVDLNEPGAGTSIPVAGEAPTPPSFWGEDRIKRAFATVSFDK